MLDKNDKQWITETIDEKLNETKTELRSEMRNEMRNEMREMKTELRSEFKEDMQVMKGEIITEMTAVFENTYDNYIKIINEIVPEKARSYDTIEKTQFQQQGDINTLKSIAVDHGDRIAKLEKALV